LEALPDLTDWERVNAMTDEEIEANAASDEDADWEWGEVFAGLPDFLRVEPKKQVTLRLDRDVLEAFKADGPGYQTRINLVLRAFIDSKNAKMSRKAS
jgi:uncharacterized protein (DUF4415 family)